MTVRYGTEKDIDRIAEIEALSFPSAEAATRKSIAERMVVFPECFWVLEEKGEILSFINGMATDKADLADEMFDRAEMHDNNGKWQMLFSVATDPACRSLGLAGTVMTRVIDDSRKRNKAGIVLTCKEGLLGFYSKFGFVNEGVSSSVHGGAVWYQMRLTF